MDDLPVRVPIAAVVPVRVRVVSWPAAASRVPVTEARRTSTKVEPSPSVGARERTVDDEVPAFSTKVEPSPSVGTGDRTVDEEKPACIYEYHCQDQEPHQK